MKCPKAKSAKTSSCEKSGKDNGLKNAEISKIELTWEVALPHDTQLV